MLNGLAQGSEWMESLYSRLLETARELQLLIILAYFCSDGSGECARDAFQGKLGSQKNLRNAFDSTFLSN